MPVKNAFSGTFWQFICYNINHLRITETALTALIRVMEFNITIQINNIPKVISVAPALYMDNPVWEISMNEQKYIIRKTEQGWEQGSGIELNEEVLKKIGEAIDYSQIKDAG
jgi:hypothetical protein